MLWYQYQPVDTYNKVGEYQLALTLSEQGLNGNESYPELHYEEALAYQGMGNMAAALSEAKLAVSSHRISRKRASLLQTLNSAH